MDPSSLPGPDLDGRVARWVWRTDTDQLLTSPEPGGPQPVGAIPVGLLIDHGAHNMLLLWAPIGGISALFHMDSLAPLSIVEPITCPTCGLTGWIHAGEWHPAPSSSAASA